MRSTICLECLCTPWDYSSPGETSLSFPHEEKPLLGDTIAMTKRCWDGSKHKILSSFLDWYKPLPLTAKLPSDIFLPDFLQAGWAPILQTAARCCQQKGHCHINGTFGFSLTHSPNQAEHCQQLVLHKAELFISQK